MKKNKKKRGKRKKEGRKKETHEWKHESMYVKKREEKEDGWVELSESKRGKG